MALSSTLQSTLLRYHYQIDTSLRTVIAKATEHTSMRALDAFYGQMQYQLGWVDASFAPTESNTGKLLRPTLVLLAFEAAGAWGQFPRDPSDASYLERALPAAMAIELIHNFTLIHDDIEDGDTERRHRPTLWKMWGVPQAINTGDGMFCLARSTLWSALEKGVEGAVAARLAERLDRATLTLAEGQYLDISFESRQDISVAMYIDMISRKTAALMSCAAEMGALLGTCENVTIERLRSFGEAVGIAFQVRDDLLGVWATTAELGKTPAGDIYRRKKSLPILHAMENANTRDQQVLRAIYQQTDPVRPQQVEEILAIMARTQTRAYCNSFLAQHCGLARTTLASVPRQCHPLSLRALDDLETLVLFIEAATR
jgi:geranylgeranyl diphosphate synthase type I